MSPKSSKTFRYPCEKLMFVLFPGITLGAFFTAIALLELGQKSIFPAILKMLNH